MPIREIGIAAALVFFTAGLAGCDDAKPRSDKQPAAEASDRKSAVIKEISRKAIERPELDFKYHPILGSMSGEVFFLHYCLPGFIPEGESDCKVGIPGSVPDSVQVKYQYSLGKDNRRPMLEGGGWFDFPFPVNADVEGRTPYSVFYKERELSVKGGRLAVRSDAPDEEGFEGLVRYKTAVMPKSFRLWVPENRDEYQTNLGNPPIFSCFSQFCHVTLDLGNGWEASAKFNEVALRDWRNLFIRFKASTTEIMEKYSGL